MSHSSSFEAARDEFLELEQLCALVGVEGRRSSIVELVGDIFVRFGLGDAS
jgi:hypothetical protein